MYGKPRPAQNPPRFVQQASHPGSPYQDFPTGPGQAPYRARLEALITDLPPNLDQKMVFHICGDTGGIKHPVPQQIVANALEADTLSDATAKPAFLYHLGDVVYYNGEETEYYGQFYLPYEHYMQGIVAIPGNHDGTPLPNASGPSGLGTFINNFCSAGHIKRPESQDVPRFAMQQPNPYWTLQTPKATFIGLYTNVPEGGEVRQPQQAWFVGELKNADPEKAIFVCLHHPVYSADRYHSGSPSMQKLLADAVAETGVHPDIVFTAHVHNYQRFTHDEGGQNRLYIVAGAGGYWNLHQMVDFNGAKVTVPYRDTQTGAVLEAYVDDTHGFMRVEIEGDIITCRYFAVARPHDPPNTPARVADFFQLNWRTNRLVR
jgi:acid phosphatase type 7